MNLIKKLLRGGVDVNIQSNTGWTPLICAVQGENIEAVKILLNYNADVNLKNQHGDTAIVWADWIKNEEIIKLLRGSIKH